jgi:hypothetical protein
LQLNTDMETLSVQMKRVDVKERLNHRFLGALRYIDRVTGMQIKRPLGMKASRLTGFTNRSSLYVISYAAGLESHRDSFFEAPDEPVPGSLTFTLSIEDPMGQYHARTCKVTLPRHPKPDEAQSIFNPIDICMFAAPAAHLSPNWSVVRASLYDVADMDARKPVPGALLRIIDADGALMMSGMSDQRGEAALIIPGIPITTFSNGEGSADDSDDPDDDLDAGGSEWAASGPVVETQTAVTLEIIVSPNAPWPVDPSVMEAKHDEWRRPARDADSEALLDSRELALKTGESQSIRLYVDLTEDE